MRADFLPPGKWAQANLASFEAMRGTVLEAEYETRCFRGLVAGILETFNATASFLSHKRTLGIVAGQAWAFDAVLPPLLRDNFQVKNFSVESFRNVDGLMDQLDAETSCVLWPEDHPLTAQIFDGQAMEEALAKKRIFSIRVSHHAYRTRPLKLNPFGVRICSIHSGLAVGVLGARYKTPAGTAPWEPWDPAQVKIDLTTSLQNAREDRAVVETFEASLRGGWKALLPAGVDRVWDRAVIFSRESSGDQALSRLSTLLGKAFPLPGQPGWVETLHLCRWEATMKELDWWKDRPDPDALRGAVLLDSSVLTDPKLRAFFGGA